MSNKKNDKNKDKQQDNKQSQFQSETDKSNNKDKTIDSNISKKDNEKEDENNNESNKIEMESNTLKIEENGDKIKEKKQMKPIDIESSETHKIDHVDLKSEDNVSNDHKKSENKEEDNEEDEEGYEFNEDIKDNFFGDNIEIEDLKKRVAALEKTIKKNTGFMKFANIGNNTNSEDVETLKGTVNNIQTLVLDHYKETQEFKKDLDDIKVKVQDFDVADIFKDCTVEGGNLDASKVLITNLKNQVFKKFSIVEDRIKKSEEE